MDMFVTHVAFTRSRCVGASDAMLCWEISVLCSSATSEATANVSCTARRALQQRRFAP